MQVFDKTSIRYLLFLGTFFAVGVALHVLHRSISSGAINLLPSDPSGGFPRFLIFSILDELGSAFLITALTGVFFELTLRKKFLSSMREYIDKSRIRGNISEVRMRRSDFDKEMLSDFHDLSRGQELLLIGTSQRLIFGDSPGPDVIVEKVASGAKIRALLVHPASLLVPCIENLSKDFGFPNLKRSLEEVFEGPIATVHSKLREEENVSGNIEIRLIRDLLSPISLHVGPKYAASGLYFSHENGTKCPILLCEEGPMRDQLVKHFEKLWKESENNVLLRVRASEVIFHPIERSS